MNILYRHIVNEGNGKTVCANNDCYVIRLLYKPKWNKIDIYSQLSVVIIILLVPHLNTTYLY